MSRQRDAELDRLKSQLASLPASDSRQPGKLSKPPGSAAPRLVQS